MTLESQYLPLTIGVDLGGTQLRVAVLQGQQVLARRCEPTGEDPAPDRIIPRIYTAIQQMLDETNIALDQLAGLGMAIAGPLDSRSGVVFASPNLPGWNSVPLRAIFEQRYALPVLIENDANVAALGEYMFGAGQGSTDMVYLTISTGIGGGIIINGHLLTGTKGTAGELGHMTVDRHGERCNCGNIGCLESIASGTAIARRARVASANGVNFFTEEQIGQNSQSTKELPIDAKIVAQAAKRGVPEALTIMQDAAEALGIGLVNIIHIFNPDRIVIGGGLTHIEKPLYLDPALKIVSTRTMTAPRDAAKIVLADLEGDVGLIGAGALVYLHLREKNIVTSVQPLPIGL